MHEIHQYATYFALIIGSICVVGTCLYAAVRCFRERRFFVGSSFVGLILFWFQANAILTIYMYAMATPNPATPTSLGEYLLPPIYLAIAGSISYFVFRYARRLALPRAAQQDSAVITEYYQVDDDSVQLSQSEDELFESGMTFDRKKIAGFFIIGIAVLAMRYGFILESILFVIVGVSMVMGVRLWRR